MVPAPACVMLVVSSLRRGGAERVVSMMANYWAEHGREVLLVTIEGRGTDAYTLHPGVHRVALNLARASRNPIDGLWSNLRRIWKLRSLVRRLRPRAVVSFMTHTNLLVLLALGGTGVRVLVSERVHPSFMKIGRLRAALRGWLYPRAAAVVVQTAKAEKAMQRIVSRAKFVVIPNPVSQVDVDGVQPYVPLRTRLSLMADAKIIIGMGRLDSQKGFDILIEAFVHLHPRFPDWRLVILGEGPARPTLEREVEESGLIGSVYLPGLVRNARKSLAEGDLFVLSSRFEGFPNVLLEAMACGRPVISFDCPSGPAEIIRNDYDGLLVKSGDTAVLRTAMSTLMLSPERRAKLGRNAREVLERFSMDRIMALWDELLSEKATPQS